MFSAMLYILLTRSLWRWNPSRCGLTTKPLPSHLRGADSPTPTAQNCTFHRAEQRERERERERERAREGKDTAAQRTESKTETQTFGCTYKTNARASHFRVGSLLPVCNITYLTPMVVNPIFSPADLLLLSE